MNTQQRVASLINSQITQFAIKGNDPPRRVLMDHAIWDDIERENLPYSVHGETHRGPTFMGLVVIRTRDADGIVEVLP